MLYKNHNDVKYYLTIDESTTVRIQNGNSKLGKGIYAVNLLPGDLPLTLNNGTQLTNVAGSCAGCCSGCKTDCYAVSDAKRYHNTVIKSQGNNTLLARHDRPRFFADVQRFIDYNMIAAIRVHSSGEFLSYDYFCDWLDLARRNPDIKFYTYTKRFNFIERYMEAGNTIPDNFTINISIWKNNYKNPYNLPEFIYDDGTDPELENVFHCPAGDKNGNKIDIPNEEIANKIKSDLEGAEYIVQQIKKGTRNRQPAPPFITSSLMQEASRKLNYTGQKTMRIAQQLYEGVDIKGEGTVGLITYLRTPSRVSGM